MAVQDGAITVARLDRSGSRPRLTVFEHAPAAAGDTAPALTRMRKVLRVGRGRVSALLPREDYSLHLVDAPSVPEAELKAAVRWRLKDVLDFPVDEAVVDVVPLPAASGHAARVPQLLAVASRRSRVSDWIDLFDRAGLRLRAIDIPEMAQRNVAELFEEGERALALVHLHAEGGLLTVSARGALHLTRTLDVGTRALVAASTDERTTLIDRLVLELQRTLDVLDRHFAGLQVSRLLIVPFEHGAELRLALAENLDVAVDIADLSAAIDFDAVPALADPVAQGLHLRVLGAALRQ